MANLNQNTRPALAPRLPADYTEITPDLIRYHVQRGRQLRAEAISNGIRRGWKAVMRGFRGSSVLGHVPVRRRTQQSAH